MNDDQLPQYPDELPKQYSSNGFFWAILIVGVLTIGFASFFRNALQEALRPPESAMIHKEFPAIEAVGWFNEPESPIQDQLKGQVFVVDAWAFWCGPCREAIPYVIQLHQKYKDKGVKFLGLTDEGLDPVSVKKSREFVESLKIPWPNGYGAVRTLAALNVNAIPQLWVVDRENRIVFHERGWGPSSVKEIEMAINKALTEPNTK